MEATRPGLPPGLHVVRSIPEGSIGEPVVVLVHGAMDRSSSFGRVARRLGDLALVRYDRRGYGRSAGLPAGTLDDQVDDLVAVIESATAEAAEAAGRSGDDARPAVVVGHSIGGVIALVAAARRPDLIASVAAFEAPMSWAPWWPSSSPGGDAIAAAHSDPARFVAEDAASAPVETSEAAATKADPAGERAMTPDPAGDAVDHFMRRMIGDSRWERLPAATRLQRRAEGHALLADLRSLRGATSPYDTDELRLPVLAGYGTESSPRHQRAVRELAAAAPNGELWAVEGSAHGVHLSHPGDLADMIRRTVERAAPPSR